MQLFAKLKNNRGFTLLEVLMYIAISSTVIVVNLSLLTTMIRSRVKNQTISEIEAQGVQILQYIGQSIRHADSFSQPKGSAGSTLVIVRDSGTGAEDVIIDYFISGETQAITVQVDSNDPEYLNSSNIVVENLEFEDLTDTNSPGIIGVEFTLSRLNEAGLYEFDYSQTFSGTYSLR